MRGFQLSLLTALMFSFPISGCGVMIVRDYRSARHDRFHVGADKRFVGASYNFSGVGIGSSGHWATLVSDNCFLSARHRHPFAGERVTFLASNDLSGSSYSYTVKGGIPIGGTDLWLGWFDKSVAVHPSIVRYPVPVLPVSDHYQGLVLFNYGLNHRVGRNTLDSFGMYKFAGSTGMTIWFDYDNHDSPSVGGDETLLESGDSGAPSFAVFNSELALIGIHWANSYRPAGSFDTFVPIYFDQINKVLEQRGQSLKRCWNWQEQN